MPLDLPPATICDLTCFYRPGHPGPHQKWMGDPCDVDNCANGAKWRRGRSAVCDDHAAEMVGQPLVQVPATLSSFAPASLVRSVMPLRGLLKKGCPVVAVDNVAGLQVDAVVVKHRDSYSCLQPDWSTQREISEH